MKVRDLNYKIDKTMADNMMYVPNDDTTNSLLCRLKLVVETFEHFINQQIKIQ